MRAGRGDLIRQEREITMRISGGNRFNRHWHRWSPLDQSVETDKVCECGAVRTWNGKKWVVKYGKTVLKQDLKKQEK